MPLYEDLLVADFNQCFEQMRHYDESFRRTTEFCFGGIVSVVAASGAFLTQYGTTTSTTRLVALVLILSSLAGFLLVVLLARNRVYFAIVARFINEVRGLYLKQSPGEFENCSRMYSDHRFPKILSPGSTQSVQIYFLSLCNASLFGIGAGMLNVSLNLRAGIARSLDCREVFLAVVGSLLLEVSWVFAYWKRKQRNRGANTKVFGR